MRYFIPRTFEIFFHSFIPFDFFIGFEILQIFWYSFAWMLDYRFHSGNFLRVPSSQSRRLHGAERKFWNMKCLPTPKLKYRSSLIIIITLFHWPEIVSRNTKTKTRCTNAFRSMFLQLITIVTATNFFPLIYKLIEPMAGTVKFKYMRIAR